MKLLSVLLIYFICNSVRLLLSLQVQTRTAKSQAKDETYYFEPIGNGRYLTVKTFNGAMLVDIREYDQDDNSGKRYPTKTGVSFPMHRWAAFVDAIDEIDRNVKALKAKQPVDFSRHIGGGYYTTVKDGYYCIDIRRYFKPSDDGKILATRKGICLRFFEWDALRKRVQDVRDKVSELANAKPCCSRDDHMSQIVYFACNECNSFDSEFPLGVHP